VGGIGINPHEYLIPGKEHTFTLLNQIQLL
jgi:hypothetical protein